VAKIGSLEPLRQVGLGRPGGRHDAAARQGIDPVGERSAFSMSCSTSSTEAPVSPSRAATDSTRSTVEPVIVHAARVTYTRIIQTVHHKLLTDRKTSAPCAGEPYATVQK
jgi:hypothetical protein